MYHFGVDFISLRAGEEQSNLEFGEGSQMTLCEENGHECHQYVKT